MSDEYFFSACSNEFLVKMHFFKREPEDQVYLNIEFDYGNSFQNIECESVGYWLFLNDITKFIGDLKNDESSVSLRDVDGCSLFDLHREDGKLSLSHENVDRGSLIDVDGFILKFIVSDNFVEELSSGLTNLWDELGF